MSGSEPTVRTATWSSSSRLRKITRRAGATPRRNGRARRRGPHPRAPAARAIDVLAHGRSGNLLHRTSFALGAPAQCIGFLVAQTQRHSHVIVVSQVIPLGSGALRRLLRSLANLTQGCDGYVLFRCGLLPHPLGHDAGTVRARIDVSSRHARLEVTRGLARLRRSLRALHVDA